MGSFMSSNYDENVHVIVVGGGYAGMAAAKALDANVRVTLIESTDSFNHKIASLRAAVVPGWERRIRVPVDNQLKNGKLIQADVKAVDTGRVTLTDESVLECDYVVLAHGKGSLNFPSDYSDDVKDTASYEAKARTMQQTIAQSDSILLVGGGAVGVELTGEIAAYHPGKKVTLVHSRSSLLSNLVLPMAPSATSALHDRLVESGVQVIMNARVTNTPSIKLGEGMLHTPNNTDYVLSNGDTVSADLYIDCTGTTRRTGNLVPAAHLDERNLVKVQPDLQVVGMPGVFCVGDANNINETKLASFARQHATVAARNILKLIQHKPTSPYLPLTFAKMTVTVGPYKGAGVIGSLVLGNYLVSMKHGRDLYMGKVWGAYGLPVPELKVVNQLSGKEL